MDEHDGGLGSCQLHLCQLLAHLLIERLQIGGDKGVNQGGAVCTQRVLIHIHDSGSGIFRLPLIGVAHHSNLNAADVLYAIGRVSGIFPGAQRREPLAFDRLYCAQEAVFTGVVAVVVGCQEHIKACILQSIHNGIRGIEGGVAGVFIAHVGTGQSGFQVGNRIIRRAGIGG